MERQRIGGSAALAAAATIVVGLGMFFTVLSDYTADDITTSESVAFVADNQAMLYIWNLITLVIFSALLVVVTLALHERLVMGARPLAQASTAFGLIWAGLLMASGMVLNVGFDAVTSLFETNTAQAESLFLSVDTVGNGLGGGMEIVGSIWILIVSLAGLKARALPPALCYLGFLMAASGLVTMVPALEAVGAIFGLGLIIWFAWIGMILLKDDRALVQTQRPMVTSRTQ